MGTTAKEYRENAETTARIVWGELENAFGNYGIPPCGVVETNIGKFVYWSELGSFPDRNGDEVEELLFGRVGLTQVYRSGDVGPGASPDSLRGVLVNNEMAEQLTTLAVWLMQKPIRFDRKAYAEAAAELAKLNVKL